MDTVVQVLQLVLETLAVIFPTHPIHTRRRRFPQQAIGRLQQFDVDMMQQGGERLVVPFRCFPYAIEPVGQAFPAQRPALAAPNRVPLGPFAPPAPRLATMEGPDFSCPCITGFGPPAFPVRTVLSQTANHEISRFPCKRFRWRAKVYDHAGPVGHWR